MSDVTLKLTREQVQHLLQIIVRAPLAYTVSAPLVDAITQALQSGTRVHADEDEPDAAPPEHEQ